MAKIADLVDDLTGQLAVPGGGSMGGRSQADPYMQSKGPAGSSFSGSAGPVSPYPAAPPVQLAQAPRAPSAAPPPMDASASVQQGLQRAALEGEIMRPPYSQPYSPMAFAVQPGFQRAPLNGGLQTPVWNAAADSCAPQGPALRASPAAQMQALQQQRMMQLQAQQQAQMAQAAAAKAGQVCLQQEQKKHPKGGMAALAAGETSTDKMWTIMVIIILVALFIVLVLVIVFGAFTVKNSHRIDDVVSVLRSPISA